jgi:hypothetical protein
MLRTEDAERGRSAYELADAFCGQARRRVENLLDELWDNTDEADKRLTDSVLDGEYTWLEDGVIDLSEGTGPWIAGWQPGPSQAENVARRVR